MNIKYQKMYALLVMVAVLCCCSVSAYAASVVVDGWVRDNNGVGVSGATVTYYMTNGTIVRTTNSSGYYSFVSDRNWCDTKKATAAKTDWITKTDYVGDGTCPECFGECVSPTPPEYCANYHCSTLVRHSFEIRKASDYDKDGVPDYRDNCNTTPNGPNLGRCTAGLKGQNCVIDKDCGCGGDCSNNQEDCNQNGKGDVCDSTACSKSASFEIMHSGMQTEKAPLFYYACMNNQKFYAANQYLCNPSGIEQVTELEAIQAESMQLNPWVYNLFGLWSIGFCQRNDCNYECVAQFIADVADGPERAFGGRPTHPEHELPECPDAPNFVDFVNNVLEDMWEFWYGDNF